MSQRKIIFLFGLLFSLLLWGNLQMVTHAQTPTNTPRPTPTRDDGSPTETPVPTNTPVPTSAPAQPSSSGGHGTIQGMVYQDVNGDGQCVGTGVAGEEPIAGVDIDFVSNDKRHIITLFTGDDGRYGLAAAGYSNWEVTVKPDANWVVTSQTTLYAPISAENKAATDINFCLRSAKKAPAAQTTPAATVLLPAAGGQNAAPLLNWALYVGLFLVAVGFVIHRRQQRHP